jgi:hypothetical protein
MENCCRTAGAEERQEASRCPECGRRGRSVDIVTLKSLLTPGARATLKPQTRYAFCREPSCAAVYFADGQVYRTQDVAVPVFQKDPSPAVPVCYCFGWTRARIREESTRLGRSKAAAAISAHVRAGRCACELTNPQGSCCLANVLGVARSAAAALPV